MKKLNQEEYLKIIEEWKIKNKEEVKSGKCKKIFLDVLPKWKTKRNYGSVKYKECKNFKLYFIYNNLDGWIEIVDYIVEKRHFKIKYNNIYKYIKSEQLILCNIGRAIGEITSEFKIEIGTRFKDDKRDIIITDRRYQDRKKNNGSIVHDKWYKYTCNVCGWTEGWMVESDLKNKGCSCCFGRTVVEGINDVATIAPWIIKYFQGGYNEAKLYTKWGSGNKNNPKGYIHPICPDCGRIKNKRICIGSIYVTHSIGCSCSDNISKGEKYVFNLLEQLKLKFITQLSKKEQSWCENYRYDFYFEYNNEKYVIEVNGVQHYEENSNFQMSLEQQIVNDNLKKNLAMLNGVKEENYIVLDYRKADLKMLKQNILEDKTLNKLFDLNNIDWNKCLKYSCSNLVKEVCNIKNNNPKFTTTQIGELMGGYCRTTIQKWLQYGHELGWCYYDKNEEIIQNFENSVIRNKENYSKPVEVFKSGVSKGIFPSAPEIERQSEELFGVKLLRSCISTVCTNKIKQYKGYTFKYISKEEYEKRKEQENLKQAI